MKITSRILFVILAPIWLLAACEPASEPEQAKSDESGTEMSDMKESPVEAIAPTEASVQPGDLVAPGPGVTIPKITRAAQPVYPMVARRLKKKAIVTVRLLVDENGSVLEAERLGDESGYGFDEAAIQAARKSEWQPADKNGIPVKMWTTVRIAFEP